MARTNFTRYTCDRCGTVEDVEQYREPSQKWTDRKHIPAPDNVIFNYLFCEVCDASYIENADTINAPFDEWMNEGRA